MIIIKYVILLLVFTLLGFNFYFRKKLFPLFKELAVKKINISISDIFFGTKRKEELLRKYPKQRDVISDFVNKIRTSIIVFLILLVAIIGMCVVYWTQI